MATYSEILRNNAGLLGLKTKDEGAKKMDSSVRKVTLQRTLQDIASWRDAIREAESSYAPARVKMQAMFLDTVLNGHVRACMDRRKSMIMLKEFNVFDSKGNKNEKATALLRKEWFYNIIGFCVDARFFGYSLINWSGIKDNQLEGVRIVRRANVNPDKLTFTDGMSFAHWYGQGISFIDPESKDASGNSYFDWSIWVDTINTDGTSSCGFGILYNVALYEIYIRNNIGYNADFVEKFVMPFIHATTTKSDIERDKLEEDLIRMASSTAFITDPTDELKFIQNNTIGSGVKAFSDFDEQCKKDISKIILGHADAIDSTPGKLGAKDDVTIAMEMIEAADSRWCENVISDRLFPKLRNLGFTDIGVGDRFEFVNDNERNEALLRETEASKGYADIVKTLHDSGLLVDENQVLEKTGIRVTRKVEESIEKKQISDKIDPMYADYEPAE